MGSLTPAALCAAAITLACAAPAAAATRPCLDGSTVRCHVLTGKVVSVGDGDTIDVDVAGDGAAQAWHVRITGIQAMELSRYSTFASERRGACHAREATRRMEELVLHRRVRLLSQRRESYTAGPRHRARRAIQVRRRGRWIDPTAALLREGHGLWSPSGQEWAWNRSYREFAQQAAAHGRRIYDRAYCGHGPGGERAVAMSLRWNADGRDGVNISGEFARLENRVHRRWNWAAGASGTQRSATTSCRAARSCAPERRCVSTSAAARRAQVTSSGDCASRFSRTPAMTGDRPATADTSSTRRVTSARG